MYFLGSPEEGVGEADFHLALHCVVQSGVCQAVPCAQVFQLVWDLGIGKESHLGSDSFQSQATSHQGVPEVDPGSPA